MLISVTTRRKSVRSTRHHDAWVTLDNDLRSFDCRVLDVSDGGAKLFTHTKPTIGSIVYLSTVPYAMARKPCEVIWKNGRRIGLRFI